MSQKSQIQPIKHNVLVGLSPRETKTPGGIILTENTKEREEQASEDGTILAVGTMAFKDPPFQGSPKVGDVVVFDRYAGKNVKHNGQQCRLMSDTEIGAIVT